MDDFGNDLSCQVSVSGIASDIEQWLISTSTYGGFGREAQRVGYWCLSERSEI